MNWLHKQLSLVAGIVALVLAFGSVTPAQASGMIVVDDDGANCHTSIHTIHDAFNLAQSEWPWTGTKTIMVCAGTYSEPTLGISGISNLKVIAKKGVTVRSDGSGFFGLMMFSNANNVTVQGFTFDGQSTLATGYAQRAIEFSSTSGSILRNTVINWHTAGFAPNLEVAALWVGATGGQRVKVDHNFVTDYQDTALYVEGAVDARITANALGGIGADYGMYIQANGGSPTGQIQANKITGPGMLGNGAGIRILEGNHFKISGNAISDWTTGLEILSQCNAASGASDNRVTGNIVQNTDYGIKVAATVGSCDANADRNVIQGNRVLNPTTTGSYGIGVEASDPAAAAPAATALDNIVRGNSITNFGTPENPLATGFGDITGTIFTGNHIH